MKEEFNRFIIDNGLADSSSKILLAVSGGIDSMVMTHLFLSRGDTVGIAHCNFNLRGSESDGDEELVRQFALDHNIPFYREGFDTAGYAAEKGISIQMAARELRYRWFEEIREQNGYDCIALAHNLNDNVETFLINLTRGTGIAGLTGMRPVHRKLIRPLLFASRTAIENYSKLHDVNYREDRTNADTHYIRNKIRHELIPLFREINPSFDSTIAETTQRLEEVSEIVNAFIAPVRDKNISKRNNLTVVKINDLPVQPFRRTLLYEIFRPFGVSASQLDDLEKLASGRSGSQLFTEKWRLVRSRNEIILSPRESDSESYIEIPSCKELSSLAWVLSAETEEVTAAWKIAESPNIASLDASKISWPLIVRSHQKGDYFYPLGMKSRKKLSDYFIDRKYSLPEKEKKLVLESAGKIAWVIGDRIDNRFKITKSTERALVIRIKNES